MVPLKVHFAAVLWWVLVVVVEVPPVELVVVEVVVEVPEVAGAAPVWAYATTANTQRTRVRINVLRIERSFVRKRSEVILRPEAQRDALAMPSQRHERGPVLPREEPPAGAREWTLRTPMACHSDAMAKTAHPSPRPHGPSLRPVAAGRGRPRLAAAAARGLARARRRSFGHEPFRAHDCPRLAVKPPASRPARPPWPRRGARLPASRCGRRAAPAPGRAAGTARSAPCPGTPG